MEAMPADVYEVSRRREALAIAAGAESLIHHAKHGGDERASD